MTLSTTLPNARERVLRAISRQGPAPYPKHVRLSPALVEHFTGTTVAADLDAHFGLDLRWLYCRRPEDFDFSAVLTQTEFDVRFDFSEVARRSEETKAAGLAVVSGYECGTFEQAHEMVGFETLLADLVTTPAATKLLLERIARNKARVAVGYAKAGVDLVFVGDDMGSQRALLVREETWHRFFRPPLQHIVDEVRAAVPDARIAYHSCGHIEPLVPYLIEVGIDVLESIQPECNDVPRLVAAYADRLAFWGGIGAQSTMARGSAAEVRDAVVGLAALFGDDTGLIVAPAHTLEADTPPENVLALVQAVDDVNLTTERAIPACNG